MRAKTGYAGAITRFDGAGRPAAAGRPRRVLVIGDGDTEATAVSGAELARQIAAAAPGWQVLAPRPLDLALLARCAVVVAPGGANAVAEAAFANCGLVCIPRPRPFDEQVARGEALARDGAAVVLDRSPAPERWPGLLEEARARRTALARWADGEGAARAADYLLALARD
jgi:predicted glycosyltransferase